VQTRAASLSLEEREKWFVTLYVNAGAIPEKIPWAERRALLPPGSGEKILARQEVLARIKAKLQIFTREQQRQKLVGDEVAKVTRNLQQKTEKLEQDKKELASDLGRIMALPRMKIDEDILEHELMRLVVGLEPNRHPEEKRKAIESAYVVKGLMESGRTRRIITLSDTESKETTGIYTSLFQRLALKASPEGQEQPQTASEPIFDLIPSTKQPEAPQGLAMPAPGEPIDEAPPKPKTESGIITVEVG